MNKGPFEKLLSGALTIAVVLLACAPVVAAFKLGSQLAAHWVSLTFQIVIAGLAIIVSIVAAVFIAIHSTEAIMRRIDHLEKQHSELLKKMGRRTPAFTATVGLITEAVKLVGDKSFEGDAVHALTISLLLIILFWVANQLAVAEERWKRIFGVVVWFATIAFVPLALMLHHDWNVTVLLEALNHHLEFGTKLVLGTVAFVLILLPCFFRGAE
jgi:hypothetical protein